MTIQSIANLPASLSSLAHARRLSSITGKAATSQQPTSLAARLRAAKAALHQLCSNIAKDARDLDALHAQEVQEHLMTLALTRSGARADVELDLIKRGYAIGWSSFGDGASRYRIYSIDDARAARDRFGYFADNSKSWTCRGLRELRCYADALPRRSFTEEDFSSKTGHEHLRLLNALQQVYGQSIP